MKECSGKERETKNVVDKWKSKRESAEGPPRADFCKYVNLSLVLTLVTAKIVTLVHTGGLKKQKPNYITMQHTQYHR